jgi:hypothetical protein
MVAIAAERLEAGRDGADTALSWVEGIAVGWSARDDEATEIRQVAITGGGSMARDVVATDDVIVEERLDSPAWS